MDLVRVETKSQVCVLVICLFGSKGMVHVIIRVLMAVHINITVFCDLMPHTLVDRCQSFQGASCLHFQAEDRQ